MRDHREESPDKKAKKDITDLVRVHHTKHPGSVRRSDKAKKRAKEKNAAKSRKANR